MKSWRSPLVPVVTLMTFGSGVVNVASVAIRDLPERHRMLREFFPLEFLHISRFATLLVGIALIVSSLNIYKRKRTAFWVVLSLACASIVFNIVKGLDYEEALLSAALAGLLLLARGRFTIRSAAPDWRGVVHRLALVLVVAAGYGIAGFWLLDRREFGIDFDIWHAMQQTWNYLTFTGDPLIVPRTRFARWFLDSLYLTSAVSMGYAAFSIFRPVAYGFQTQVQERSQAREIIEAHGRSALDYFKCWPDKSYFFSPAKDSVIAYRVGAHFSLALGDPVGLDAEIPGLVGDFLNYCRENDWGVAFYQTLPDFLPVYAALGLRKLKIGDDAVVDVTRFTLTGSAMKSVRAACNRVEKAGYAFKRYEAPLSKELLAKLRGVSDDWLQIPGRRERGFTLGYFHEEYVQSTPVYVAENAAGNILGFMNQIPSYRAGEVTIDLMRHRRDAPNGVMDFLFAGVFQSCRERGFQRFNMGMAPMAGFQEREEAGMQERAIHQVFQNLNMLFSFSGIRSYKAKFATHWEPRYLIYRNAMELPRMLRGLREVSRLTVASEGSETE